MMTTPKYLTCWSTFRQYLKQERLSFLQSPILVIASEGTNADPNMIQASKQVNSYLLSSSIPSVSATVSNAYPSLQDLHDKQRLAKRAGVGRIILGVGSGAAMDLSKALASTMSDTEQLIMVPSSFGARLVSESSHSLLWNPDEQALVVEPSFTKKEGDTVRASRVILDSEELASATSAPPPEHVLAASLAIQIDAIVHRKDNKLALEEGDTAEGSLSWQRFTKTSRLLSYGKVRGLPRSTPLALAASILPQACPSAHMLTFMGSVLPGLLKLARAYDSDNTRRMSSLLDEASQINSPELGDLLDATNLMEYLEMVRSSRRLWNAHDVDDDVLYDILYQSSSSPASTT